MNNVSSLWKLVRQEKGPSLAIFKVRFDWFKNLRNNKTIKTTVLESQNAANIIAITKDQKIVLVKQFRFGTGQPTIEAPGGFVDEGEDHQLAAKRELLEETGYGKGEWEYLGYVGNNPAFMNSYVHHWLAKNVELIDELQLDDGENIEVKTYFLEELKILIESNNITHPHTISALARVFNLWNGENL